MNKSLIIVLVLILVGVGAFVVNKQNQEAAQLEQLQLRKSEEAKGIEAQRAEAEAQKAQQLAMEQAKKLEEAAKQQAATSIKSKIGELIAKAKSLLESGNYQEAVTAAKNILSQDANNTEAKSIIETAMAKIKEVAQQQAVNSVKKDPAAALEGLTSGFGK